MNAVEKLQCCTPILTWGEIRCSRINNNKGRNEVVEGHKARVGGSWRKLDPVENNMRSAMSNEWVGSLDGHEESGDLHISNPSMPPHPSFTFHKTS